MAAKNAGKIYDQLCETLRTAALLQSTQRLIEWDQETHMPENGLSLKTEQAKLITEMRHKLTTSRRFGNLLSELIHMQSGHTLVGDLPEETRASIREMRRDYLHQSKLSTSFIKKFTQTTTEAVEAWKIAKTKDSFKTFAPHLKKIVSLLQKKAQVLGYKEHPYDALLDEYEPGMTSKTLDEIFVKLKSKTLTLLTKIEQKQTKPRLDLLEGDFPIEKQRILSKTVIKDMGLSEKEYNLAETHHPFCCGLYPNDIRITTHFYPNNFMKGFTATMHECGHALYDHGLPSNSFGTPLSEPASFGIHESQSRIWETFIGHSYPFWKLYYPKIKELFPNAFKEASLDEVYQAVNYVEPSFIRIHADEVTYNLHIIIRYEIEKGLIDGSYDVKDLPDIWNQKMRELLGIIPKTNSEGCLQDIHWSLGYMGYFPSYTLGNIYAGQLYLTLIKTHTDWDQRIKNGDLLFIKEFLKERIHRFGRQYTPMHLIEKATHTPFSADPYLAYLEGKFGR